jgi:hypothetical protein
MGFAPNLGCFSSRSLQKAIRPIHARRHVVDALTDAQSLNPDVQMVMQSHIEEDTEKPNAFVQPDPSESDVSFAEKNDGRRLECSRRFGQHIPARSVTIYSPIYCRILAAQEVKRVSY